jgi:hypothetical protein
MRVATQVVCLAAALVCARTAFAQAANFAGTWTLDRAKTNAANVRLGAPPEPNGALITLTVTQDAASLTVQQGSHAPRKYRLDGSESTNPIAGVDGQTIQVAKAMWDGARLKIVIKGPRGDTNTVWSLEGGDLMITTTAPAVDGVTPPSTALVFKKVSQ